MGRQLIRLHSFYCTRRNAFILGPRTGLQNLRVLHGVHVLHGVAYHFKINIANVRPLKKTFLATKLLFCYVYI